MLRIILLAICGIVSGIIGGMGMGGGTLLIPCLTMLFNISQHHAQIINLLSFVPMAIVSVFVHKKNGLIKKSGIGFIIIPALIVAVLFSVISQNVEGILLSRIFGGFLILLAIVQAVLPIVLEKKSSGKKKEK